VDRSETRYAKTADGLSIAHDYLFASDRDAERKRQVGGDVVPRRIGGASVMADQLSGRERPQSSRLRPSPDIACP